ncbi:MAG: tRNA uridine-5-carboxymethylaminomethyl(34) synthesis GTPase MnmE [Gammaproteobacteria bacterium]|nr:tRNA uridine-5-carboxymethylaminomethyl(34) synthesis GTPase MnmE [Gammaproteobacteria bacterium]
MIENVPVQSPDDTIAARATPPGRGGIAVIRVSGRDSPKVAAGIFGRLPDARRAELRDFVDSDGQLIDRGLVLFFPAPHSFTGEDVLELQTHGGPIITELVLERVLELGARVAEPGEFTLRAFLNDKLDLNQAEAIADLIDSGSRAAARAAERSLRGDFSAAVTELNAEVTNLRMHVEAAIDFPDEDVEFLDEPALRDRIDQVAARFREIERSARQGVLLRDGVHIVLAGRPNAGKSSLLNRLAGYDAAIVTEVPGTTRDVVREHIELDGLPVHVVDTAGLRPEAGRVEAEGIRRAREQLASADHALLVVDATADTDAAVAELCAELPAQLPYTVARNKIDLTGDNAGAVTGEQDWLNVSALDGSGMDALRAHLKQRVGYEDPGENTVIARQRHLDLLETARSHFDSGCAQLLDQRAGEIFADELLQVQNALAAITGDFSSDDLLGEIFSRFCIGK